VEGRPARLGAARSRVVRYRADRVSNTSSRVEALETTEIRISASVVGTGTAATPSERGSVPAHPGRTGDGVLVLAPDE
jgi:hypothetical protein